jgi:hypothetical protein
VHATSGEQHSSSTSLRAENKNLSAQAQLNEKMKKKKTLSLWWK